MSFKLKHQETASAGLTRIVLEQIDDAVRLIKSRRQDQVETVHEVRKDIKKIRAVLRLLRGCLGTKAAKFENIYFRDIAHQLSDARDAQILTETVAKLEAAGGPAAAHPPAALKQLLAEQRDSLNQLLQAKEVLYRLADALLAARDRAEDWANAPGGWQSLEEGLRRSYKRGRRAYKTAYAHPTFVNFHQWRKRAKDLLYQLRILKPLWPETLTALAETADELSEFLGDEHDLAVLEQFLRQKNAAHEDALGGLFKAIAQRREDLRKRAKPLGAALYADKASAFVEHFDALWHAWQ